MVRARLDKGSISSLISLGLLIAGWFGARYAVTGSGWLLAAGLFGFAGGMTNWLAVKMLFDPVPLLYGSGVIPARFREIRAQIRDLILRHFFSDDQLSRHMHWHCGNGDPDPEMERLVQALMQSSEVDAAIDRKLAELVQSPLGMVLQIAGARRVKPLVREFLGEAGQALAPRLQRELNAKVLDPALLRERVDQLLAARLEELSPDMVKKMMEEVIREHLGWLVVWGNVLGGVVGVLSRALGYAS